jgi:S-adenosylmethionine:tRNA ribosyltransferase-isomerase
VKVSEFDFELPPDLIAQHPVVPRDAARMLEVDVGTLADRTISDLPHRLRSGDLLVYNNTSVIKARLRGKRGEAGIEVTLHKRVDDRTWRAFARPAKKLRAGDAIRFAGDLWAQVTEKGEAGEVMLSFSAGGAELMAALDRHGIVPLPPYIRRAPTGDPRDAADYRTVWSEKPGAVAASTAGLHFSPELLAALDAAGIARAGVTLHVGAGTFLPVTVEDTDDHVMHSEWGEIGAAASEAINRARAAGGRIVAVGTTALRLLETAARAGDGPLKPWSGDTDLFIVPGFRFRVVDLLLTNFHLPRSTLLMLVAAFAGHETIRAAYAHAIAARYRFYSYGDCCLLHPAVPR